MKEIALVILGAALGYAVGFLHSNIVWAGHAIDAIGELKSYRGKPKSEEESDDPLERSS